ncbi:hypothetical protein DESC_700048 [Desulfosarcina cetonica]|uniref:DUF2917 domain-containing protein n=1 Tax=Desulfosarcina cetonica TaxID=90730 RepID=UPI0006D0524A|nr:DUF2917 domain-containing protein [Desulfosarcina cetonica]VTR68292.1 hypothetical protein DESC_700048 [Desulfosarcina cetonica]
MKHRINDNGNALNVHQHFFLANSPHPDTVIDLTAGQKWRLMGKRKYQTLFCLRGRVWITQERDIRDYVLEEGDAFIVTQRGLVIVRAISQARIGYAESIAPLQSKGYFRQTSIES